MNGRLKRRKNVASKSKAKGKGFEREIANHLSGIFDLNFERVPNSGAFTGGKNAFRDNILTEEQSIIFDGDIMPPKELGKTEFECKFHKEIPFHLLYTECKLVDDWLEQAKSDTKWWFLIFKANRRGRYVAFDNRVYYTIHNPVLSYKDVFITSMEGFFEANKDTLLKYNETDFATFLQRQPS